VAATVAMEYSPHPVNGGDYYIKLYLFDGAGDRGHQIDLDGGGPKAFPDLCVNCHGGRPASSEALYENEMESPDEGRLGGRVRDIPCALETFDYGIKTAFTRADQLGELPKAQPVSPQDQYSTRLSSRPISITTTRALLHGTYESACDENELLLGPPGTTQDERWIPTGTTSDADADVVGGDWSGHEDLYQRRVSTLL
jgi:hypothetical protein